MIRLVQAPSGGQGPRPPGRRRYSAALALTSDEARHLRASLKNLRYAFGTWACLADAMGVSAAALVNACSPRHRPSVALALRAAQAAGMSVEAILTGKLCAAGRCPTCGTRIGTRPGGPTPERR